MKVAFITPYDSSDLHAWSGIPFRMRGGLTSAGLEVHPVGPLSEGPFWLWYTRLKKLAYRQCGTGEFLRDRELGLIRAQARAADRPLKQLQPDALFFPGSLPLALMDRPEPAYFWTDATFGGQVEMYEQLDAWAEQHLPPAERARFHDGLPIRYNRLAAETIRHGNELEQQALDRAQLAIFGSPWAAETATRLYRVDPEKVRVVPMGANLDCNRTEATIDAALSQRSRECCHLLFLAVEWARKGGDFLLSIAKELKQRGVAIQVHIVGCTPPDASLPDEVQVHGFLSKKKPGDCETLEHLLHHSHFLVMPTRAECLGIVMAEASSYGLPSLVGRVGGTQGMVREGINGWTFPLEDSAALWADRIQSTFEDWPTYEALAHSSFREFRERLNWETAGQTVRELMKAHS